MAATTTSQVHYPPVLPQPSGTPAHEWAQQTVGVLDGDEGKKAPAGTGATSSGDTRSVATTPGLELPGAFPSSNPGTTANTTSITESAQSALESTQHTVAHTAQGVYDTAEKTARQYLPTSVVLRLEGVGVLQHKPTPSESAPTKPTLPSHDSESSSPSHPGGVGSLPGTRDEAGVAQLPHEKDMEGTKEGVTPPQSSEKAQPALPLAPIIPPAFKNPTNSNPTLDRSHATLTTDAADAKRGIDATTTKPTPTPSALNHNNADSTQTTTAPPPSAIQHASTPTTTSSFMQQKQSTVDTPIDRDNVTSPHTGTTHGPRGSFTSPDRDAQAAVNAGASEGVEAAMQGQSANAGAGHRSVAEMPSSGAGNDKAVEMQTASTDTADDMGANGVDKPLPVIEKNSSGSAHSRRSSDGSGKATLAQKIRGEVKVLAGKMSKDAKKVEEGKAMMKGGNTST
ncbi:hypothetical protein K439DRAFT_1658039 [Ramaria rubella]|nr:hypothetical protein K439DRAFT_1658039 [Ramaria rubella]